MVTAGARWAGWLFPLRSQHWGWRCPEVGQDPGHPGGRWGWLERGEEGRPGRSPGRCRWER